MESSFLPAILTGPGGLSQCLDLLPTAEALDTTLLAEAQTFLGPFSDHVTASNRQDALLCEAVSDYKKLIGHDPCQASRVLRTIGNRLATFDPANYASLVQETLRGRSARILLFKPAGAKSETEGSAQTNQTSLLEFKTAFLRRINRLPVKKQVIELYRIARTGAETGWALAVLLQLAAFHLEAAEASYELALEAPDLFETPHLTAATALAYGNFWIQKLVDTMLEKRPYAMLSGLIQGSKIPGNVSAAEKLYQEAVQHLERFQLRHVLALTDLAAKNYWAAEALKSIANSEWMMGLVEKDRSKLLLKMQKRAAENAEIDAALGIWFERAKKKRQA